MYVKRHEFFRWTPRTAWLTMVYVAFIPAGFLYLGYRTEVRSDILCHAQNGWEKEPALILSGRANTRCEASLEGIPFRSFKKISYTYRRWGMPGDNKGSMNTLAENQSAVHNQESETHGIASILASGSASTLTTNLPAFPYATDHRQSGMMHRGGCPA